MSRAVPANAERDLAVRVNVEVAVADLSTVEAVAALVADQGLLRIIEFGSCSPATTVGGALASVVGP